MLNPQPLKVLLIAPLPPPVGGIASWTVNVTSYYQSLKSKNVDLNLCDSSSKSRRITSRAQYLRIYYGILNSFNIYKKVKNDLKTKPDVIHLVSSASFSLLKDILILRLAKKNSIPVITHWRFGRIPDLVLKNNWEYKLLKRVILKSHISIVIDQTSYNAISKKKFSNVVLMPNPIAADVGLQSERILKDFKIRPKGHILFVGHVVREKGVYELVEACTSNEEVTLTLVGPFEDQTKEALLAIAKKRKNGSWLIFSGALDKTQVLSKMQEHSIVALPSYTEGFPNVVLEGMAMGCAIIGTSVGAIPEMINAAGEKPCGICVPHKNSTELENAVNSLISNPGTIEEMGKNGLKKVLSAYTMQKVFAQYQSHWSNAIESKESHTK